MKNFMDRGVSCTEQTPKGWAVRFLVLSLSGERKMVLIMILEKYAYKMLFLQGSWGPTDAYLNLAMPSGGKKPIELCDGNSAQTQNVETI